MVLHEVLHEFKYSKGRGLILKIDFEKAYDRVNWDCLRQVLESRNFPPAWIGWVMSTVEGGSPHQCEWGEKQLFQEL